MAVLSSVQISSSNDEDDDDDDDDDTLEIVPTSPTDTDDSTSEQGELSPAMESESKPDENDQTSLKNHMSLDNELGKALEPNPSTHYSQTNDKTLRERMDCPQEGPQQSIRKPIEVDEEGSRPFAEDVQTPGGKECRVESRPTTGAIPDDRIGLEPPKVGTITEVNDMPRLTNWTTEQLQQNNDENEAATILATMAPNARPSLAEPIAESPTVQQDRKQLQLSSPTSLTSEVDSTFLNMLPQPPIPSNVMLHMTLQQHQQNQHFGYPVQTMGMMSTLQLPSHGRRKILLKLLEDQPQDKRGFFFRRKSSRSFLYNNNSDFQVTSTVTAGIPRGQITVSWFEGTTSTELQEHVRNSVARKMGHSKFNDLRIMDETVDPPEEIVLSPYIPDGSEFLLQFRTREAEVLKLTPFDDRYSSISAPLTPSAAPSPFPSTTDLANLNAHLLARKLDGLEPPLIPRKAMPSVVPEDVVVEETTSLKKSKDHEGETASQASRHDDEDVMGYSAEDQIEHRLRQLADLLLHDKRPARRSSEKRQVIFVLANYFILFLSMVAVFAEIQARAPSWLSWVETQMESVQQCAIGQEALFDCVQRGDFSGLIASFVLWVSRSAATKQFFLFGYKSSKHLWTSVYESFVTAICWGTSYMLIRRGMNPDTRKNFLRKYWKDAVYGSLAGFNASFMKQVLKNLIPQEALEDALQEALQERKLKILSWLPSFKM